MELLEKFFDKLSVKRRADFGSFFPDIKTQAEKLIQETVGQQSEYQNLFHVIESIENENPVRPSQRKSAYEDFKRLRKIWKKKKNDDQPQINTETPLRTKTTKISKKEEKTDQDTMRIIAQAINLDWEFCGLHDTQRQAEWKCLQCEDFLCNECANAHKKGKKLRFHRLIHYSEREKEEHIRNEIFCAEHESEFTMFCEEDKKLICAKCSLTSHKDHEMKTLVEVADARRTEVGSVLGNVDKNLIPKCEIVRQKLNDADDKLYEIEEDNCELLEKVVKSVINKIHSNAEALKEEMRQRNDNIRADIQSKLQKLNTESQKLFDVSLEVRRALEGSSMTKLVLEADSLAKKLKREVDAIDLDLEAILEDKKDYGDICKSLLENIL